MNKSKYGCMTVKEASHKYGIPMTTLQKRIDMYDITLAEAVMLGRSNRALIKNPPIPEYKRFNQIWLKKKLLDYVSPIVYI